MKDRTEALGKTAVGIRNSGSRRAGWGEIAENDRLLLDSRSFCVMWVSTALKALVVPIAGSLIYWSPGSDHDDP